LNYNIIREVSDFSRVIERKIFRLKKKRTKKEGFRLKFSLKFLIPWRRFKRIKAILWLGHDPAAVRTHIFDQTAKRLYASFNLFSITSGVSS
jgi:hypothetical protein